MKLEEDEEGLTDKDKNTLSRWKELQQHTRPFIHPIRKLVRPGEVPDAAYMQQQDMVIKQQFAEIEKQQKQIVEYEKMIKERNNLVSALKDKHKAIVLECQVSGVKLSKELLGDCTPNAISSSCQVLPTSSQPSVVPSRSTILLPPSTRLPSLPPPPTPPPPLLTSSSLPPASPANVFSPPTIVPAYPNISPTNRTPPPNTHILQRGPHHPAVSMVPFSSSCTMNSVHNSTGSMYPQINPRHMVGVGLPPNHSQFIALNRSQMLMAGSSHAGHAQNQMEVGGRLSHSRQQPYAAGKNLQTSPAMLIDDLSFSPLTSSELKELEEPPGIGPTPPLLTFNDDLDSILNLSMPSGSGAGYGVGVKEEELSRGALQIDLRYIFWYCCYHKPTELALYLYIYTRVSMAKKVHQVWQLLFKIMLILWTIEMY